MPLFNFSTYIAILQNIILYNNYINLIMILHLIHQYPFFH